MLSYSEEKSHSFESSFRRPKKLGFFAKQELVPEGTGGSAASVGGPPMGSPQNFFAFDNDNKKEPCFCGSANCLTERVLAFVAKNFSAEKKAHFCRRSKNDAGARKRMAFFFFLNKL